ncbi:MAG: GNAT family N-acetyltransferase [Lachnospiraceae bacterium]|nr:GNAT family N-acetyltransferase [Lachnospiraceae bacterium]
MQKRYKELLITDEMHIAQEARKKGEYVVLCYPLADCVPTGDIEHGSIARTHEEACDMSVFPYAVENAEELDETYLDHVLCRLKGIPCHILDTERCRVREITPEDVDRLYEIYADPQITKYMENLYESREDEIAYTKDYIRCHYGFYDFGMWIVEDKKNGKIIGRAGFDMREGYEEPELGFMICRNYQQKGYAGEVCGALLSYGKKQLGFEKVGSFTNPENTASVRLLCRLGFSYQSMHVVNSVKEDRQKLAYYQKVL